MLLPLPNLDDRRWADLVEEGISLISLYAPEWTDHNIHDPGITLIELFAYLAEMDIYQLNRISDKHKRKFLSLVGISPRTSCPANIILSLSLKNGADPIDLPATTEFVGKDPFGKEILFHTQEAVHIVSNQLIAVYVKDSEGVSYNVTSKWQNDESFYLFGNIPQPGAELILEFDKPLPQGEQISIFFKFANQRASQNERKNIAEETKQENSPHHSVRTEWEFYTDKWTKLDAKKGEVIDNTRSFTLDGFVKILIPAGIDTDKIHCYFVSGSYDEPPKMQKIVMNSVSAEQSVPVGIIEWCIDKGAIIEGKEPANGDMASFDVQLDENRMISRIKFLDNNGSAPLFRILNYRKPTQQNDGNLSIEAELLDSGSEKPNQQLDLSQKPVVESSFQLFTLEQDGWHIWKSKPDFDASRRCDADFLLDSFRGIVTLGDGEKSRVAPLGVPIIVTYHTTNAGSGNLAKNKILQLCKSPHNEALLIDFDSIKGGIASITNQEILSEGLDEEKLANVIGRVIELMEITQRAVTLEDYETLAFRTPGVYLARVKTIVNFHPDFPCMKAPGIITLIIVPNMPVSCPKPSEGLLKAVSAYLCPRRVIGTRVVVTNPSYLEITIRAEVKANMGVNKANLQQKIINTLNNFLHPLKGGTDGKGWQFGRNVYRSDILQVIDEIQEVDHVTSLEIIPGHGEAQCGNVPLCPTWLVTSGQHQIKIL